MHRQGGAKTGSVGWASRIVFYAILLGIVGQAEAAPVKLVEQAPVTIRKLSDGQYLLDFGKAAFGNLKLVSPTGTHTPITVRFGEALRDGRVDRTPPGSVRYSEVKVTLNGAEQVVAPPPTRILASHPVPTPPEWGAITPFRWVEIAGWPATASELKPVRRRAAFDSIWQDGDASFHSSDAMLDRVWELCHYSIQATTFAGIFVDGDRERTPYEADAYLSQLGYYAGNPDSRMERDTFTWLIQYPTWPTEWAPHMVFIAYADWLQTGDRQWLAQHYAWLKTKMLTERTAADGLIHSTPAEIKRGDIVDWPVGERDDYVFTPVNTVVNAFAWSALDRMRLLALALDRKQDAEEFSRREDQMRDSFERLLYNPATGLYRDGIGTDHSSLHANLFPLAFGMVPQAKRAHVAQWLAQRGMRGSVYAAQYLLEGLFENGQSKAALDEMTAPGNRSWKHMVDSGTTITWEAWDQSYKPNQDWNHAWGAAPANLLPRFVLGVQASTPGWTRVTIEPHPGDLRFAGGVIPTPKGPIHVDWKRSSRFRLSAKLAAGQNAIVRLPAAPGSGGVWKDGRPVAAHRSGEEWLLESPLQGSFVLEVR